MARLRQPITPERVKRAASNLGPIEREILALSAGEHLERDEIAERLGLSAAEVDRRLAVAVAKLHRILERQERPWWKFW